MNIHEYQAKELYRKYDIPCPKGIPAFSVEEAKAAAEKLIAETGSEVVVVKAQIHAGGRGKGGGVKVVKGAAEAEKAADALLGMNLVTHQTVPRASSSSGSSSSRAWPSIASSTSRSSSTARRAASPSWRRPKAASTSRRSPRRTPEKIHKV